MNASVVIAASVEEFLLLFYRAVIGDLQHLDFRKTAVEHTYKFVLNVVSSFDGVLNAWMIRSSFMFSEDNRNISWLKRNNFILDFIILLVQLNKCTLMNNAI